MSSAIDLSLMENHFRRFYRLGGRRHTRESRRSDQFTGDGGRAAGYEIRRLTPGRRRGGDWRWI